MLSPVAFGIIAADDLAAVVGSVYHFAAVQNYANVAYFGKVVVKEENKDTLQTLHERNDDGTKYGWISPDGKYFHCGYQGHVALAENICFGMIDTNNAERYLEEHGWCKVYKPLWENKYKVYTGEKHVITDAQMKTLLKSECANPITCPIS